MAKYKVKKHNTVHHGATGKDGKYAEKLYVAGDVFECDEAMAAKMEHALEPFDEKPADKSDKPVK